MSAVKPLTIASLIMSVLSAQWALAEQQPDAAKQAGAERVVAWCMAWSETDLEKRAELLEQSFAETGSYGEPGVELSGRAAVDKYIGEFHAKNPGSSFGCSPPELSGKTLRFAWELRGPDGAAKLQGMDFVELAEDGRFNKVIGFPGAPPEVSAK